MKDTVNKNLSMVEVVTAELAARKWRPARLSRETGVSEGVLSRFFKGDGISADNLYKVLTTLDLIAGGHPGIPAHQCAPNFAPIHELLDYIIELGDKGEINALKYTLQGVLNSLLTKQGLDTARIDRIIGGIDALLGQLADHGRDAEPESAKQLPRKAKTN